jgi:iron complex outermembrane recepter protein
VTFTGHTRSSMKIQLTYSILALSVAILGGSPPAYGQDLSSMSIEDLVSLDITSVSKKPEKIMEAPSAVYVITGEDIRRSGVKTITDAFRLAPGVDVFKRNGVDPVVTIRSQNTIASDKVLILEDGRTLNDPFNNYIIWPSEDILLEDVDRIEVIRGAAGVLWGENAVSGLINIITKKASQTQGLLATVGGGGTLDRVFTSVRYGDKIGLDTHYKAYLKYSDRGSYNYHDDMSSVKDGWEPLTAGIRFDSDLSEQDKLFVGSRITYSEGDYENHPDHNEGFEAIFPEGGEGSQGTGWSIHGHAITRWTRSLGEKSDIQLGSYFSDVTEWYPGAQFKTDTIDVDLQHRLPLNSWNDLVWGGGYRAQWSHVTAEQSDGGYLSDPSDYVPVLSTFINDEMELIDDTLRLSLGTKLTHNKYTGWEAQPAARLTYLPSENATVFTGYTRAVRSPSRVEHDYDQIVFVVPPETPEDLPFNLVVLGDSKNDVVAVDSYELGSRIKMSENVYFDIGGFFALYHDGLSAERPEPEFEDNPPRITQFSIFDNNMENRYWGGELLAEYRPMPDLRLIGMYRYLEGNSYPQGDTTDRCDGSEGSTPIRCKDGDFIPDHIFTIRTSYDVTERIQLDSFLRYNPRFKSNVRDEDGDYIPIKEYTILDLRAAYKWSDSVELAIVGQNLIEEDHVEFFERADGAPAVDIPRTFYAQVQIKM